MTCLPIENLVKYITPLALVSALLSCNYCFYSCLIILEEDCIDK